MVDPSAVVNIKIKCPNATTLVVAGTHATFFGPATVNVNVPSPPAVFFVISKFPVAVFVNAAAELVTLIGTVILFVSPEVFVQPAGGLFSVTV